MVEGEDLIDGLVCFGVVKRAGGVVIDIFFVFITFLFVSFASPFLRLHAWTCLYLGVIVCIMKQQVYDGDRSAY